jgi:deoxyadenosine/deoxycytidine kinase
MKSCISNAQYFDEDLTENPYLEKFYSDMQLWGFHSRIAFLGMKAEIYKKLDRKFNHAVIDRSLDELIVIAKVQKELGIFVGDDYETYLKVYENLVFLAPPPNLIIYVTCSVETSLKNIRKRGRPYEANINFSYLEKIKSYYREWLDKFDPKIVVEINTDEDLDERGFSAFLTEALERITT